MVKNKTKDDSNDSNVNKENENDHEQLSREEVKKIIDEEVKKAREEEQTKAREELEAKQKEYEEQTKKREEEQTKAREEADKVVETALKEKYDKIIADKDNQIKERDKRIHDIITGDSGKEDKKVKSLGIAEKLNKDREFNKW